MRKIVLASSSPRRKQLLCDAGYEFEVLKTDADENISVSDPKMLVQELAIIKACARVKKAEKDCYVIGADTVVCIGNKILGKPKTKRHARLMLKLLSGRRHFVYTGVCVFDSDNARMICKYEESSVVFKKLSNKQIRKYVDTNEPMDKAGAYAIQGLANEFVREVKGEFDNIVGLPMKTLSDILKTLDEEL